MYFAIAPETAIGFVSGPHNQFMATMTNLKRDPFEEAVTSGTWNKTEPNSFAGSLAGPVTGYIYDWNMLPIGQLLWLKELESYKQFPPLQAPESWNLDQVIAQIKNTPHASQ
jgi:arylsulfatase